MNQNPCDFTVKPVWTQKSTKDKCKDESEQRRLSLSITADAGGWGLAIPVAAAGCWDSTGAVCRGSGTLMGTLLA